MTRLLLCLPLLAGCAADPPVATEADNGARRFDPAPMPFVSYGRPRGTVGALEIPIPPKVPLGTGAVPVSNSPARGSIVSGVRESF